METWFIKSVIATLSVTPTFIAIPFFKARGIDPLIFLIWYFLGSAAGVAAFTVGAGKAESLAPPIGPLLAIFGIGLVCGSMANGNLFQAVGIAPNPGLPPVIYATASLIVFMLSIVLFRYFPDLFKPVSAEPLRLAGIGITLFGLYLLSGGRLGKLL